MEIGTQQTLIANPAATYCAQVGGIYDLTAGTCTLNGVAYDAWNLYYAAQGQVSTSAIDFNSIMSPIVNILVVIMMMKMMFGMMKTMNPSDTEKYVSKPARKVKKYVYGK